MSVSLLPTLEAQIRHEVCAAEDPIAEIERLRDILNDLSPMKAQPVDRVRWVPIEKVSANDYNPNAVASAEMKLLYTSILHDGLTQPVVTIRDGERFTIVDGFHRYSVCREREDIHERNLGLLPIVVIDKPLADRMASTVRHNRARGRHSVRGMSSMVFDLLDEGWDEAAICNELGMEPEEILRLKHITGFSKLFENAEYKRAWQTKRQILARKAFRESQAAS